MKGLPDRVEFSAVPSYFLNEVMPKVSDITELKLSLHLFRILYRKKGPLQYVTFEELGKDPAVLEAVRWENTDPLQVLKKALDQIIDRGIIACVELDCGRGTETACFVNTSANRKIAKSVRAELKSYTGDVPDEPAPRLPDIFEYYEQNIGLLTPIIADELRLAEKTYPHVWIIEAISEAVYNNKRNWRYIAKILDRWQLEGKSGGAYRKDYPDDDPAKFTRGKYQRFVRH